MFKRFHDTHKSKKKQSKPEQNVTYAQLAKTTPRLRTQNYATKHQKTKNQSSLIDQNIPMTVQCFKTDQFLFQGVVKGTVKSGEGIMILRNGMMIVGNWINNFLEGRALIFTAFGGRILANFNRGKLNGWMISFYRTNIIRCTLYYENNIDGERLTFDEKQKMWVSSKCAVDGKVISILHAQKGAKGELPSFVRSQELREMFNRFVVIRENYLQTQLLQQFQISLSTSYVGFVDEQKRPCGLGCAYSDHQMYCGNFFQGVLEHYGRMLFENGDIYQGQLLSGTFWGRGMYYSPFTNQTSILLTDYQEQSIERQFQGYVLIDIAPTIGQYLEHNELGIKGSALRKAAQNLQPYYLKDFSNFKKISNQTKSNMSQCGHSEQILLQYRGGKQMESNKTNKPKIENEEKSPYFSPQVGPMKEQKWIKFNENQLQQLELKKSVTGQSDSNYRKKNTQNHAISRNNSKQQQKKQVSDRGRLSPSNKVMTEIFFPQQNAYEPKGTNQSKVHHVSGGKVEKSRSRDIDWIDPVNERDQLVANQQESADSRKLAAILQKSKTYRKKIFH